MKLSLNSHLGSQPLPHPSSSITVFIAKHDIIWYGISFWPGWVNQLGHSQWFSHSQVLAYPQPAHCQQEMSGKKRKP